MLRNKHVIIAGLDGDYKQQKFGEIIDLIPLCDDITKIHAICAECGDNTPASFSKRCVSGDSQTMIGANDIYKAVCRKHLD